VPGGNDYVASLRRLSPGANGDDFRIEHGSVRIHVRYFPGSHSHMLLETPYVGRPRTGAGETYREGAGELVAVRPMEILLRREDSTDRAGKREGVAVEAQLGDPLFDAAIYVDTRAPEDVVRRVLAAEPLRAAVRDLVGVGVSSVTIDDAGGLVSAVVHSFSELPDDPAWMLDRIAAIATHLPEVRASGGAHPEDPWRGRQILMGVAAVIGALPTVFLPFVTRAAHCYVSDDEGTSLVCDDPSCCAPLGWGAAIGITVGLVAAAAMWPRIRGTSSSHRVRRWVALFAVLLGLEGAISLAHVLAAIAGI
jgi:hypothetical protein